MAPFNPKGKSGLKVVLIISEVLGWQRGRCELKNSFKVMREPFQVGGLCLGDEGPFLVVTW